MEIDIIDKAYAFTSEIYLSMNFVLYAKTKFMSNKKNSSNEMASKAAAILKDNNASEIAKQLAGSVLSQVNKGNETGKEMETIAAKVLESNKYSEETKALAGSVLSQSDKNR